MTDPLFVPRAAVALLILGYAASTDWKTWRAPNWIWTVGLAAAAAFFVVGGLPADWKSALAGAGGLATFGILGLWIEGLGGADSKAFIVLSVLLPWGSNFAGLFLVCTGVWCGGLVALRLFRGWAPKAAMRTKFRFLPVLFAALGFSIALVAAGVVQ